MVSVAASTARLRMRSAWQRDCGRDRGGGAVDHRDASHVVREGGAGALRVGPRIQATAPRLARGLWSRNGSRRGESLGDRPTAPVGRGITAARACVLAAEGRWRISNAYGSRRPCNPPRLLVPAPM